MYYLPECMSVVCVGVGREKVMLAFFLMVIMDGQLAEAIKEEKDRRRKL